ncbi:hypothetical protein N0V93_002004 [Gnomoniopsis smithogilvyi]|uniref:Uncharacterized protein n=1 Tax=Gnomoniopsis smithogilvyi TaxID=1191159 RepID=A0A9W8Z704_9PEZI|nr:hypothetical protein N0V93_002004 [Gnomoniopsis smithogilvyi]
MKFIASLAILAGSTSGYAVDPAVTNASLPDSCTYRPTATSTATTGCPTSCDTIAYGAADAAVVIPCGCTTAVVEPTTTTVCPTTTACVQFNTGWGIAAIPETGCPPAATSH